MSEKEKSPLVPRLRFPEFREAAEWGSEKLEQLITTVSPPSKLQSSSYRTQGKFPIIDQSQELICGWTDDESAVIDESLPLIVFGDHTCALKFVEKPFAQGADGIKILKAKPSISAEYLFHSLSHRPLAMEDYKRHYSILKERAVVFPDIKSGEQQKIADCLSSLDDLIAAETQKLDTLKTHKKGLMQQLFPREGEAVPRLRFPEFREAGEWATKTLAELAENLDNRRVPVTEKDRTKGNIPYYGASGIVDYIRDFIFDEDLLCISEDGANLRARTAPIAFSISGKTWVNNHAHVLRFDSKCVQKIVEDYLNSISLEDYLTGMAQPKLNRAMLDTIPVPVPQDDDEQQAVSDCLSSLDDLITAQSQKIDAIKIHKKGLIQQLFPVLDEVPA